MKTSRFIRNTFIALFGVVALSFLAGCATTAESENRSSRPWGYVRGYDHGLPSMLNEGR